ncbi:MAG TPA: hypothetical protein VM934_09275 [Pyrinomonadaceae bacterium]|nr:hypothetical protein [Pyrinomonadaceae bacterium]
MLLALCCPALAGEIPNPPLPQPPPATTQEPTTDGEIECGLTEAVLGLLDSILPLL